MNIIIISWYTFIDLNNRCDHRTEKDNQKHYIEGSKMRILGGRKIHSI